MRHNIIETLMGAVVLAVAALFLVFAYQSAGLRQVSGYELTASFDKVDGVKIGTDVKMSGIKVGVVSGQSIDPVTFDARLTFTVDSAFKLPDDTAARIAAESLLGGTYVALIPGGSDKTIPPGGAIRYTQGSVDLIDLLTKVFAGVGGAEAPKIGD